MSATVVGVELPRERETEREAQLNLQTVLQLCAAGQLRCSDKTKRPSAATVGAVASELLGGDFYVQDPIAAFAWPLLLQAGGLASVAGGRLQLSAKGQAALRSAPADVIRSLWSRWVTHGVIDEMSRVDEIKGQRSANALSALRPRREAVDRALTDHCPPGEWVQIDDLFGFTRASEPQFSIARNERGLWKLYIVEPEYGSLGYDGYHDWSILEGRYMMCVLFEYAATLGLIDVAYDDPSGVRDDFRDNWGADDLESLSRYDGLLAVRCNTLGEYVLGHRSDYQSGVDGVRNLKILPNRDITALGDLSSADLMLLDAYAERQSDRVWTLSAARLLRAMAAGRDVAEFAAFLADHGDNELPSAVRAVLDDAARRAGQLKDVGLARIIKVDDPAVAALIAHDRTLSRLCEPLGDRRLVVPVDQEPAFRKQVQALGYLLS